MTQRMPPVAYALGLGGVIPFVACGIAAVSAAPQSSLPQGGIALAALIAYGAIILSFLGAVHWGLELRTAELAPPGRVMRLSLSVVPALIGWACVLLGLAGLPEIGLAGLIVGFFAIIAMERRWSGAGLVPSGYMTMRWILTLLVEMTLITVLALRLLGATITF